jgi:hypothetical protein
MQRMVTGSSITTTFTIKGLNLTGVRACFSRGRCAHKARATGTSNRTRLIREIRRLRSLRMLRISRRRARYAGGAAAVAALLISGHLLAQAPALSKEVPPTLPLKQVAYIKASNAEAYDHFACGGGNQGHTGNSIALSGDGSTMAVGAPFESSGARGINGNQNDNSTYAAGASRPPIPGRAIISGRPSC